MPPSALEQTGMERRWRVNEVWTSSDAAMPEAPLLNRSETIVLTHVGTRYAHIEYLE